MTIVSNPLETGNVPLLVGLPEWISAGFVSSSPRSIQKRNLRGKMPSEVNNKETTSVGNNEVEVALCCSWSPDEMKRLATGTEEDRAKSTIPLSSLTKETVLSNAKMTFLEELACILFLAFGVPNAALSFPLLIFLVGRFLVGNMLLTCVAFAIILAPLAIFPQPFIPSTLQSWMANQIVKYFSYRFIIEERPPSQNPAKAREEITPTIMVAPPHGVFPYGNILAMLVHPSNFGYPFRGLASSAALRPPIFKQILRSIGVIDASRHVARRALENKESIGISTGGVAEVFETNADDECILLKERIGLIKLAIRTGADITPCYLFGNTKILSCWAGEGIPYARPILEYVSRKLGFALIIFYGRFGLPIPRRTPILSVMGRAIPTKHLKCEDPTMEQIEQIQKLLLENMEEIFDRYKGLYDWEQKKLIIK